MIINECVPPLNGGLPSNCLRNLGSSLVISRPYLHETQNGSMQVQPNSWCSSVQSS